MVNLTARWKLQFVGHFTNVSEDFVGTKVFECQFLISSTCNKRLSIGLKLHVYQIAHLELMIRPVFVLFILHALLSSQEVLL
jgi:hypothetical protein